MYNHMKKMLALCPLAILFMAGENGVVVAEQQLQTIEQQHEGEWVYPAAETTNSESLLEHHAIQQRILRRDDAIDTGAKKRTNARKRKDKLKRKNKDKDTTTDTTTTESTSTSKSSKRGKKRRGKGRKSSKGAKSTASPTRNPTVFP